MFVPQRNAVHIHRMTLSNICLALPYAEYHILGAFIYTARLDFLNVNERSG